MRYAVLFLALAASAQDGAPRDMLAAHNAVRTKVGVASLVWSEELARAAQEWANTLIAEKRFDHWPKSKYGENMYRTDGGRTAPAKVVEQWAAESANFDYRANKCKGVCGHYTQIVWRDTKEVGCAVARGGSREVWVCEYTPAGNYVGRRPY